MDISGQVIEIFDYLGEKLGLAIDWGSENVLPYIKLICENLVKYNIVVSIIDIVTGILLLICFIVLVKIMYKAYKSCLTTKQDNTFCIYCKYYDGDISIQLNTIGIIGLVLCCLTLLVGIPFMMIGFNELIKWIFIPEISLIEYITNLMSQL